MFCPECAKEHQISPSVLSIITQQKSKQRSLREDRFFFTVSKFEVVCCEGMPVDLFAAYGDQITFRAAANFCNIEIAIVSTLGPDA